MAGRTPREQCVSPWGDVRGKRLQWSDNTWAKAGCYVAESFSQNVLQVKKCHTAIHWTMAVVTDHRCDATTLEDPVVKALVASKTIKPHKPPFNKDKVVRELHPGDIIEFKEVLVELRSSLRLCLGWRRTMPDGSSQQWHSSLCWRI